MAQIQTFVFFDTEATGLPCYDVPKITELAMIACSREHLLEAAKNKVPRVISKLLLPFNPCKNIHPDSTEITGLDNFMLDKTKKLDDNTVNLINCFFSQLNAPICLVAHNGDRFDYPLLKRQLKQLSVPFNEHILCVDSLTLFKKIEENATSAGSALEEFVNTDLQAVQKRNEKTPSKGVSFALISRNPYEKPSAARRLFASQSNSSSASNVHPGNSLSSTKKSYKLTEIYKRLNERTPDVAHNAEADTITMLLCAIAVKDEFVQMADSMAIRFDDVGIKF
ncbi:three-prime repair exonuclease 1 [Sitodiplosis mosellana]|uniref:three-prime repair exonuclease 1 n=1 Tax=Sitodiplosis mosellana TaxID=263140 RepID=UPI0024439013|nr:three-prime repair exonuclease 1 [Sitodiplosis mosellana]